MAEVRKFDPSSGEGLQKLVRDALGETVRPVQPGGAPASTPENQAEPDASEEQGLGVTDLGAASSYLYYGPEGS